MADKSLDQIADSEFDLIALPVRSHPSDTRIKALAPCFRVEQKALIDFTSAIS